jgi:hypothetical protein
MNQTEQNIAALLAGTGLTAKIAPAPALSLEIVMHGLRITKDGITYNGETVKDVGAVHAALQEVLLGKPLPPAASAAGTDQDKLKEAVATSVLRTHADLEAAGILVSTGILQIGNLMSNIMYELAQQLGKPLERYECQQMDKLRKDWDAAMNTIAKLAQQQGGPR